MLAVIEDNDGDYLIYKNSILNNIEHIRFETLEAFKKTEIAYSAVLTDLGLPDISSSNTVRAIRKETDKPIYVLTGTAGIFLTGKSFKTLIEAGAEDVFEKAKVTNNDYAEMVYEIISRSVNKTKTLERQNNA